MGNNQVKLIEGYLEAEKGFLNSSGHEAEMFKTRMEAIVFAYEAYAGRSWEYLMDDYRYYTR